VKRHGGCGLVVTEMVSAEGRSAASIGRSNTPSTAEEAADLDQIAGRPDGWRRPLKSSRAWAPTLSTSTWAARAEMRSTTPCSLMREPGHAASVIAAMTKAVSIPVTVKMRAGWDDDERNAPVLAKMVEDAGAAAIAVHGRTAAQSYSGSADWDLVARIADDLAIPVFGSGDCVEPEQVVDASNQASKACWWDAACCAIPGSWRRPWTSPRGGRPGSSRSRIAGIFCSSTSIC
jgi:tRNA-dihydrouridine synthase B